jgi:hypothetical protein
VRKIAALLGLALLLPACAPKTEFQKAGTDQEIARDILWEMRNDPRLREVRVTCVHETVTLEGRVSDAAARQAAEDLARGRASAVVNKLEVKPR